ncbi:hypothetical protein BASA50_002530 [Batrachochytrium salamandrivorans]|uniref:Peroxisomal ATPase PEX1 n=1 Tax=Batrachochytrium salamandrivorans TaxID=1357716 RepID=A0ABQ8FL28_9FUNG|nr:hypothetical protein BASA50_002530 [Batrachochytrium salamandrivorans]KAH9275100.1 hypothetical protein BASA83_002324 [Batrachochytrium salamandrivorans]
MSLLTVSLIHTKTCFANLPLQWADDLWDCPSAQTPGAIVLELTWKSSARSKDQQQQKTYVGWAGGCVTPPSTAPNTHSPSLQPYSVGFIELDVSFARAQGISHGQLVTAVLVPDLEDAHSISVEPLSIDDWEILELHAGYLEEQILNQLRAVFLTQVVTIWIHHQTCVHLKIVGALPSWKECLRLAQNSEIIVAPKLRLDPSKKHTLAADKLMEISPLVMRFLPLDHTLLLEGVGRIPQWTVLVSPNMLPKGLRDGSRVYLQHLEFEKMVRNASGESLNAPSDSNMDGISSPPNRTSSHGALGLHCAYATLSTSVHVPCGHVVLGPALRWQMCLQPFNLVRMQIAPRIDYRPARIDIVTDTWSIPPYVAHNYLYQYITEYLSNFNDECIIFDGMTLPLPDNVIPATSTAKIVFSKTSDTESTTPVALNGTVTPLAFSVRLTDIDGISVGSRVNSNETIPVYGRLAQDLPRSLDMPGFSEYVEASVGYLSKCVLLKASFTSLNLPNPAGMLICGASGSGKTMLSHMTALRLARHQRLHHATVNCTRLKQLPAAKVVEAIEYALLKAVWHAPSLIIFDDLDALLPQENEQSDVSRSRSLSHAFMDLIERIVFPSQVFLMATALDRSLLNPTLLDRHAFGHTVVIKAPTKQDRVQILSHLVASSALIGNNIHVSYDAIASQMDGYVVADIEQVVERAQQALAMRRIRAALSDASLSSCDFDSALEGFQPSSMQGIKLQSSEVSWNMIGGMHDTKRILLETLQWPTLYPQIFSSFPIRLRSGLLLFGYPGCGKTMLASAVAKECGLNFISVKGPELLNKYIGSSEKAVRDLFERAQAARPCCLFFDEFDSVAPHRGHDNTGVTDRVVNQMLTQMDGVEGLEGVFILAATSRPDLIDSALLRPGRLDKAILCDMPTLSDRLGIIKAIAAKIPCDPSISFQMMADRTEGLSGADLQGMLYSAQLVAIRETMEHDMSKVSPEHAATSTNSGGRPGGGGDIPFIVAGGKGRFDSHDSKADLKQQLSSLQTEILSRRKRTCDAQCEDDQVTKHQQILVRNHHIQEVLSKVRPSVSIADRKRLSLIYRRFGRGESGPDSVGTRETLA